MQKSGFFFFFFVAVPGSQISKYGPHDNQPHIRLLLTVENSTELRGDK